ncbi:hypothetical protein BH23ACT9_BH23ACT9_10810 [soil metagenome]
MIAANARPLRPLRIAAVDDHEREEAMLQLLLDDVPDMTLVAFETTHRALLDRWDEIAPDVVLVDVRRQPPDHRLTVEERPWEEFRAIVERGALTFAMSVSQEARDIIRAWQCGAIGYLRKQRRAAHRRAYPAGSQRKSAGPDLRRGDGVPG